ncbi:EamA family transporter [Peribacillus asahii]|uniref:EamA family transporter n=1 Tax=Peribacillus asahii TaxID=228899 RepID=A0A398AVN0_9BACI|nr:DMT family transporter [Peribacillus asahii]RID81779.1 EamA family transporter [Peribacillus asahii]
MQLLKYSIMMLIGAICYGTLSSLIKIGYSNGFNPGELVGSQYVIGWVIIAIVFLFSGSYRVSWKHTGLLLLTGMLAALVGKTYAVSVQELPASIAVVFLFQCIWMGTVIECLLARKWPGKNRMIAIGLVFVGTLLTGAIFGQPFSALSIKGVLFGLLSALIFSIYMFCNARFATKVKTTSRLFYIGTGGMLAAAVTANPVQLVTRIITTDLWQIGILLGLLGVAIPFFLFAIALPKVGVGLGAILSAAELPSAMVTAVLLLGEYVSPQQWFGISLIVVGMLLPDIQHYIKKSRNTMKIA